METVIRVTVLYLFILIGLRVMGKRELSQLSPSEFVAILLVSEIAQNALIREDYSLTNAFIGIATLFTVVFLLSFFVFVSKKFATLVEGQPTVLVEGGKFIEESLAKERVTPDEIYNEMHKSGLEKLSQVKWGILETDGKISLIATEEPSQGKPKKDEEQAPI
jgi:uncharacterized membrane protein YcaP (DUF421 family)